MVRIILKPLRGKKMCIKYTWKCKCISIKNSIKFSIIIINVQFGLQMLVGLEVFCSSGKILIVEILNLKAVINY